MSVQALSYALYQTSGLTPAAKLILVTIADHCNVETGWAWPSTARLAALTGVGKRQVIRHIEALESAGLLHVQKRAGRPSGYRIITQNQAVEPAQTGDTHVTTPEPTGDISVTALVTPTSPPTGDTHVTGSFVPVTSRAQSGDTHVTRTVRTEERKKKKKTPAAPEPASRLAGRVDLIASIIPDSWTDVPIVCDDPRLDVLDDLTAAGWTPDLLKAVCAGLPKPRTNPTGLLAAHLGQHQTTPPEAVIVGRAPNPDWWPKTNVCPHDLPTAVYCHDCHHHDAIEVVTP